MPLRAVLIIEAKYIDDICIPKSTLRNSCLPYFVVNAMYFVLSSAMVFL